MAVPVTVHEDLWCDICGKEYTAEVPDWCDDCRDFPTTNLDFGQALAAMRRNLIVEQECCQGIQYKLEVRPASKDEVFELKLSQPYPGLPEIGAKLDKLRKRAGSESDATKLADMNKRISEVQSILDTVETDGSWGVHNLKYTEALLLKANGIINEAD